MEVNNRNKNKIELLITQKETSKIQGLFEDPLFPPTKESLNSFKSQLLIVDEKDETRNVSWRRFSEIFKTTQCNIIKFNEKDNSSNLLEKDIISCNVQNYEFLSLLNLFAKYPKIMRDTILNKTQINKNGYFDVYLYVDGEPVNLIIDDYFPVFESEKAEDFEFYGFNLSETKNIWPFILAKAYVKFNLYFNNNKPADFISSLELFTPYPLKTISNFKDNTKEIDYAIKSALKNGFAINSTLLNNEKTKPLLNLTGLDSNQVYEVLDIQSLQPQSINGSQNNITLLKVHSQYAKTTWIGDWSYDSPFWNRYLKEQLRELTNIDFFEFESNKKVNQPNEFWISLDDFIKFFEYTVISCFSPQLNEQHFRIEYNSQRKFNFVSLKVKKDEEIYFIFNQMNPNFLKESDLKKYDCLNIFLIKLNKENNTYEIIENKFSNLGRINLSGKKENNNLLEQGDYLIAYNYPTKFEKTFLQMSEKYQNEESKQIPQISRDVILSVFSKNSSNFTLEPITEQNMTKYSGIDFKNFWFSAIENYIQESYEDKESKIVYSNYQEVDEKACKKATLLKQDNFGFSFIFYANLSDGYLNEKLTFKRLENFNIYVVFQKGNGNFIDSSGFSQYTNEDNSQIATDQNMIERFLPKLTENSSFFNSHITGSSGAIRQQLNLKIEPKSRAIVYFEKINESCKIKFRTSSVFTYPPETMLRATSIKYKFTQNLHVTKLKFEDKDVDITQNVLEYGNGVLYFYKNNTRNQAVKVNLKFKNAKNLIKLIDSNRIFKALNIHRNEEADNSEACINEFVPYNAEEKGNLDHIILDCKARSLAFLYLETRNPFEEFLFDVEIDYEVRNSYTL